MVLQIMTEYYYARVGWKGGVRRHEGDKEEFIAYREESLRYS